MASSNADPGQGAYGTAILDFKDRLGNNNLYQDILQTTSVDDVYSAIEKLQMESARGGRLRALAKMRPFLDRLRQYASVIDVFTQATPDILCVLWGPIKLLIQFSSATTESLGAITNAFADIGALLPEFQVATNLFGQNRQLKDIFVLFFQDILDFYAIALTLFGTNRWRLIFSAVWPGYRDKIKIIMESIERHTFLMRNEVHLEQMRQEHVYRLQATEHFEEMRRLRTQQEYHIIETEIAPKLYYDKLDWFHGRVRHETCKWLSLEPTFSKWLDLTSVDESARVIWLKGIPGVGKKFLASTAVDAAMSKGRTIFVFLSSEFEASTTALSIFHSLIFQLASSSDSLKLAFCDTDRENLRSSLDIAASLLTMLLSLAGPTAIVIGGVDKINEIERGRLLHRLLGVIKSCVESRLFVSSRDEADIAEILQAFSSITVDSRNAEGNWDLPESDSTEWPKAPSKLIDTRAVEFQPSRSWLVPKTNPDMDSLSQGTTDLESIFTTLDSAASSQSSAVSQSISHDVIKEITDALLSRDELRSLYALAVSKVDERKCYAHFRGFLRKFALSLCEEASDSLEVQAAQFLRSAAGRVSDEIHLSIVRSDKQNFLDDESSRRRLESWLISMTADSGLAKKDSEVAVTTPIRTMGPENDQQEDASNPGNRVAPLVSISQVRDFMLSSRAFDTLVRDMKSWLRIGDTEPAQPKHSNIEPKMSEVVSGPEAVHHEKANTSVLSDSTPASECVETDRIASRVGSLEHSDNSEQPEQSEASRGEEKKSPPAVPINKEMGRTVRALETPPSPGILALPLAVAHSLHLSNIFHVTTLFDSLTASHLFQDLLELFAPALEPGHRRLRWRCSCGTLLWGDFDASDPGALSELIDDLHHVPAAVEINHHQPSQRAYRKAFVKASGATSSSLAGGKHRSPAGPSSGALGSNQAPEKPTPTYTRVTSSQQGSSMPLAPLTGVSLHRTAATVVAITQTPVHVPSLMSEFFEVCVNTGNHAVRLKEIDLELVTSDRELFEQIWDRYSSSCRYGARRIFLKPNNVHFVMFSVARATYDLAGIHKRPSEYPPQEELDQRRYHYVCPKILMPANIFLHFLYHARSGEWDAHADDTWLRRLPKKLGISILNSVRQAANPVAVAGTRDLGQAPQDSAKGDVVFGWGVHILEGPNHMGLCVILGLGIAVAFLVSCLLVGFAKTQEQGFGVGQFLLAIVACGMAAVYFALTDR